MKTRTIPSDELKVGDTLEFLNRGYRVTAIESYSGPLSDIISHIAHVEGYGSFMSLERGGEVRIAV